MPNSITLIVALATLGCFSVEPARASYFESDTKGRPMPSERVRQQNVTPRARNA